MEAKIAPSLQFSVRIEAESIPWRSSGSLLIKPRCLSQHHFQFLAVNQWRKRKTAGNTLSPSPSLKFQGGLLEVSCSIQNSPAPKVESQSVKLPYENALKGKSQEIVPYLNGRSIYLVGMMGCGKTTVGKVLSEVLGYSFVDSDVLVERNMGKIPVAEIFKRYGEGFFRDKESEVLWELSLRHRLVVSTGGGAVIRSVNWEHMQKGISIWLDVPLKALAQRIAAVGTNSRPLLQSGPGDVLEKTYGRLSALWEERGDAYANANAKVSLERIAAKLGHMDISSLTPAVIAIEVLEQIKGFLREEDDLFMSEL